MRLRRRPHRTAPETIVALIDVVFFLLVFFLLIGRLDATAPFELTPAVAASGVDMPGGGITVAIAQGGALALDGRAVDGEAMDAAIAARLVNEPGVLVRVNAHRAAALRDVLPVIARIEAMGARDVVLVVTPPDAP
jgi:biopolymer transport protein ExbD